MPDWFVFILACFACFRLSELITVDDGPFDVLIKVRALFGAYDLGENGEPKTSIGRGVVCPYCIGVWLALFISFAIAPLDWYLPLWWLSIAGGAATLQHFGRV